MIDRCPTEGELALYAGDDLEAPAAAEVRRHLPGCVGCQQVAEDYRASQAWLASQRKAPLDQALLSQLQERLVRQLGERRPPSLIMAWLARAWEYARPVRQPLMLVGVATWLVVVVMGELSVRAPVSATGVPPLAGVSENAERTEEEGPALAGVGEMAEDLSQPDESSRLRIELATRDPDVRIIWFASNTGGR